MLQRTGSATRVASYHGPAGGRAWRLRAAAALTGALLLAACGSTPLDGRGGGASGDARLTERVDERTAVNVVALSAPLVFSSGRGSREVAEDLALGPVEINRQGERTYFLWVNLLGGETRAAPPRLRLVQGGEVLLEVALTAPELSLPVSRPPYRRLADWALEAWYPVAAADLARLQGREGVVVEMAEGANWVRFEPWERELAGLDAFISSQLASQVATR